MPFKYIPLPSLPTGLSGLDSPTFDSSDRITSSRRDNIGIGSSSSINRNEKQDLSASHSSDTQDSLEPTSCQDELTRLCLESSVYKEAYKLFSSDTAYGKPYLVKLEQIVHSQRMPEYGLWDDIVESFGGVSGWQKALIDNYNIIMDEIRDLTNSYYNFINTLPSVQVEQQRDAGYNASVTGASLENSDLGYSPGDSIQPNSPAASINNEQFSKGIESFVSFVSMLYGGVTTLATSESIMGMLDLAEREGYNKQEVHDLFLAGLGVDAPSPYRVIAPGSNDDVKNIYTPANVEKASSARVLDKSLSVPVGEKSDSPNAVPQYVSLTGRDIINKISEYNVISRLSESYIKHIRDTTNQQFIRVASVLDNEYNISRYGAGISENEFNIDFYDSRDGYTEGISETSIADSLAAIRQAEAGLKEFEKWVTDYKSAQLEDWGSRIAQQPSLAPFFYKALFDFGMEDTFYHQSALAQGAKYGLDMLNNFGSALGSFFSGFSKIARKAPSAPKKVGQTTRSSGPKGDTITDTIYHYE